MQKYARIEIGIVQEVVDYNPYEIINENFHYLFHPCPDEVEVFWQYDENTKIYTEPDPLPSPPIPEE
jgi:hypothetical protein